MKQSEMGPVLIVLGAGALMLYMLKQNQAVAAATTAANTNTNIPLWQQAGLPSIIGNLVNTGISAIAKAGSSQSSPGAAAMTQSTVSAGSTLSDFSSDWDARDLLMFRDQATAPSNTGNYLSDYSSDYNAQDLMLARKAQAIKSASSPTVAFFSGLFTPTDSVH